jgi:hypothetical protein
MRETTHHLPGSLPRTTILLVRTLRPRAHVLISVTPILLHTSGIARKPIWLYTGPAWLRTLYIFFVSDCTDRELVLPLGMFLPGQVPCTVFVYVPGNLCQPRFGVLDLSILSTESLLRSWIRATYFLYAPCNLCQPRFRGPDLSILSTGSLLRSWKRHVQFLLHVRLLPLFGQVHNNTRARQFRP